jgi:hypothetical protein
MFPEYDVEKVKTHAYYVQEIFCENCTMYEVMWKNMLELDGPQVTI